MSRRCRWRLQGGRATVLRAARHPQRGCTTGDRTGMFGNGVYGAHAHGPFNGQPQQANLFGRAVMAACTWNQAAPDSSDQPPREPEASS